MTIKYIEKTIEDANTGADVKYHEITAVNADYKNKYVSVTIESYISRKTKEAGKEPVGSPITLSLNHCPTMAENVVDWAYQQLIQPLPQDYAEPEEKYYGWVDPYLFSGGKVKETEPNNG
ncbi:hypothetical protein [Muribacter muris]|uniref:hypothetical protein n=1 Tax=Muribacter muris TaxID=67855 RepID=UPI000B2A0B1D|nr:hypothetical protein [Muribacter muris]